MKKTLRLTFKNDFQITEEQTITSQFILSMSSTSLSSTSITSGMMIRWFSDGKTKKEVIMNLNKELCKMTLETLEKEVSYYEHNGIDHLISYTDIYIETHDKSICDWILFNHEDDIDVERIMDQCIDVDDDGEFTTYPEGQWKLDKLGGDIPIKE